MLLMEADQKENENFHVADCFFDPRNKKRRKLNERQMFKK